ncbi:MAG: sulfatase [Planctomycetota bacterium]
MGVRSLGWVGILLVALAAAVAPAAPPNVLFIAIDDLNDVPGFMGRYPDAITPNLDRIAERGVVFTDAHCQFPVCAPSRASLMSGFYPYNLGFQTQAKDSVALKCTRERGGRLLPEHFRDHGYYTMAVGKLLHRHVPDEIVDESGGRGDWNKLPSGKRLKWDPTNGGTMTDWGPYPGEDSDMTDHQAADWAIKRLGESYDKPFMLMVGFLRPHVPWHVPQQWFDLYPDPAKLTKPAYLASDLEDVPKFAREMNIYPWMPRTSWAIETGQWQDILQAYLACTSFVDHQVGRVLEALEQSPHAKNTVIVLWSDHGYHLGEKNTFQKQTTWERASHVPMVFSGPGIVPGGRCDRPVGLIDIYPTLVELAGLPANKLNEGRSLVPLLEDPGREWDHPVLVSWKKDSHALQTDRYRYIRYGDGSEELYDHASDPNEWTNVVDNPDYEAVKRQLAAQLAERVD